MLNLENIKLVRQPAIWNVSQGTKRPERQRQMQRPYCVLLTASTGVITVIQRHVWNTVIEKAEEVWESALTAHKSSKIKLSASKP